MKIKILSDTHGHHDMEPLEEVDLLIHCGDASHTRILYINEEEFLDFWAWWEEYPATYKVYVPGNHDAFLESPTSAVHLKPNNWILIDETIEVEGIRIHGSPYTPTFGRWSFMKSRDKIYKHWELIEDVDILVTHGPPRGILDGVAKTRSWTETVGCSALANKVREVIPRYHFFGHIHDNGLTMNNGILIQGVTTFINASQVEDGKLIYGLKHKGRIIDYGQEDNWLLK